MRQVLSMIRSYVKIVFPYMSFYSLGAYTGSWGKIYDSGEKGHTKSCSSRLSLKRLSREA